MDKRYNVVNNITGWLMFVISAIVYIMTAESTASFWDCPEFIISAFKLEVGHPPGNTFFNLTGRFFANFAGGDVTKVALAINIMSAICSAGTILFLFWTITHLLKKIVCRNGVVMTPVSLITIIGSGIIGSLIYTFSDTFWFSAVEAEVYAFSSFMTALVFWIILKWEANSDSPHSDRYLILIAYIIGLSIGVHLLNLLTIPAIVLVYYFKKRPDATLKGSIIALIVSMVLIGIILYGLVPGFVQLCSYWELLFVNVLGLSYNSGTLFFFFLVIGLLIWGIAESRRGKNMKRIRLLFALGICFTGIPFIGNGIYTGLIISAFIFSFAFIWKNPSLKFINTTLLSLLMIIIGYSTFAQIIIRSVANTPMDQNSPDEIFSFTSYLNREQYGDRPLFFGNTFVSELERDNMGNPIMKTGAPIYSKYVKKEENEKDKYVKRGYKEDPVYIKDLSMLFTRMYSSNPQHIEAYKEWTDFKGKVVKVKQNGQDKLVRKPTFAENLKFFFRYQIDFMYFRYFMWNFSGRQNDIQADGGATKGNWITGINFIDSLRLGDQSNLPHDMRTNKARNSYFMLPLILGVLGIIYQLRSGKEGVQGTTIVALLFFMTGLAIVIYLNQTPYQPRERDYAYAASFYAFAIWTGFGVAALIDMLNKISKEKMFNALAASIVCLYVPARMCGQNWDDHNRHGRYIARDMGYNYLTSIGQNGIVLTAGDNDTFPLWYAQEVEGYRTDVKVCNLHYLQTDWYIDQMRSPTYDAPGIGMNIDRSRYSDDNLNIAYLIELNKDSVPLSTALELLISTDERTKKIAGYSERIDYIPSKRLYMDIDSAKVVNSNALKGLKKESVVDKILIPLQGKNVILKNEIAMLLMLDSINKEGWKRPIYMIAPNSDTGNLGIESYFYSTGMAYQLMPMKNSENNTGVNTEVMYDNMINKFLYRGLDDEKVYYDETARRMISALRMHFATLADALYNEGKYQKAKEVIDFSIEKIPDNVIPYDFFNIQMGETYLNIGEKEKGKDILSTIGDRSIEKLEWCLNANSRNIAGVYYDMSRELYNLQCIAKIFVESAETTEASYYAQIYMDINDKLRRLIN